LSVVKVPQRVPFRPSMYYHPGHVARASLSRLRARPSYTDHLKGEHMTSKSRIERAVSRGLAIGTMGRATAGAFAIGAAFTLAAVAVPVQAQEQAPSQTEPPQQVEEVVVTGSMIKRINAETAVPITILKADVLKDQGITSVEQALDQLTSNVPAINITQS